jgi:hypothetical protein
MARMNLKESKETTVFAIDKDGVYQVNLYDFIMESAEETTTPHGVDKIDYVRELLGDVYKHENGNLINEYEYNLLEDEDKDNYSFFGEAPIKWELRKWIGHGSKSILSMDYDNEEDAQQALFEANIYDFEKDDQRDTSYYLTEGEAKQAYIEIINHL